MKKHVRFAVSVSAFACILAISGCAGTVQSKAEGTQLATRTVVENRQAQMKAMILDADARRIASQEVGTPYISGNAIPLSRELRMPEALRKSVPVTAHFANKPVDLLTALNQISTSAAINLVATADALMPASAFAFKTAIANAPSTAPGQISLRANNVPLWQLLDDVAAQAQVSWKPTPTGAEFYRVETRTYELSTIPQVAATNATLGRNSSAANAFSSDSKTTFTLGDSNQLDAIKSSVEALTTLGGKFTVVRENQTLIVTDTVASHERIESFVKRQNAVMSRRVRMMVEAIEVVSKEGADFGIDWSLVYNTTAGALSGGSPTSLTGAQAGSISMQQTIGPLSGSSMVIKALNEIGHVVSRRVFPFVTSSGRPITQALRSTFNYVDQIQTTSIASSTNNVTQAPTVSQKDETVGTLLTLVPTAKSDGTVFLSVSFDVTSAEPLRPYTVGTGASAVTVQQKTINGSGVIQEVPVRSGRTEIIGGVELLSSSNTKRRLADGAPIIAGGSDSTSNSKSVTVLLVTAVTEEGV